MKFSTPVDTGQHLSHDRAISFSECVNLMPYVSEAPGSSVPGGLVSTPGCSKFAYKSDGSDPTKGKTFRFQDQLYVVAGYRFATSTEPTTLYKVLETGEQVAVALLDIDLGISIPIFTSNGEVMCITFPGDRSFFYDPNSGVTKITDPVFQDFEAQEGGVLCVTSGDGYFIFCTELDVFKSGLVTDPDKGTSFNALDVARAEYKPDRNVGVAWLKGELTVFGTKTVETWGNVAGVDFPFERIDGATIEKGISEFSTLQQIDNSFVWVGRGENENYAVWRAGGGGSAIKISSGYIDSQIENGAENGFSYSKNGQVFYGINTDAGTAFIDLAVSTKKGYSTWHQRGKKPPIVGPEPEETNPFFYDFWYGESISCASVYNKVIVDGVYELRDDLYTEDLSDSLTKGASKKVKRFFTSPYLQDQGNDLIVRRVELRAKNGVGTSRLLTRDEVNINAEVEMLISDDNGRSWVSAGNRSLGKTGEDNSTLVWPNLGRCKNTRLFKFVIESGIEIVFLDLVFDIRRGRQG